MPFKMPLMPLRLGDLFQSGVARMHQAYGILAQVFDSSGTASGNVINVNTTTASTQAEPAVAGLSDGRFVVTWESSNDQDGSGYGIFGQIYDARGAAQGQNSRSIQQAMALSVMPMPRHSKTDDLLWSGKTRIALMDQEMAYSARSLMHQVRKRVASFQLTQSPPVLRDILTLVCSVMAASSLFGRMIMLRMTTIGVFQAQRFNSSGVAVGDQFSVNTHTAGQQEMPEVTGLENGGFVVVWKSYSQEVADRWTLHAQVFDASGAVVEDEFRIDSGTQSNADQFFSLCHG